MPSQWIRYQVREHSSDSGKKFIPHFARDRDTGVVHYDPKDLESARVYAMHLGVSSYIVQITESVIEQF